MPAAPDHIYWFSFRQTVRINTLVYHYLLILEGQQAFGQGYLKVSTWRVSPRHDCATTIHDGLNGHRSIVVAQSCLGDTRHAVVFSLAGTFKSPWPSGLRSVTQQQDQC